MKGIQIGKEEVKLFFAEHMFLYLENSRAFTKSLLKQITKFSKVAECKIKIQTSVAFNTAIVSFLKKQSGEQTKSQYFQKLII